MALHLLPRAQQLRGCGLVLLSVPASEGKADWPFTLRQTLEVSLEMESLCLEQRLRTVRETTLEEDNSEDGQPDHKIMHHLTELVRRAMKKPSQVRTQGEQHITCCQRTVTCWHCGKKGHVQRECPTRGKPITQSAPQLGNKQ